METGNFSASHLEVFECRERAQNPCVVIHSERTEFLHDADSLIFDLSKLADQLVGSVSHVSRSG